MTARLAESRLTITEPVTAGTDYLGAPHAVSTPSAQAAPTAPSGATSGVAPEDVAVVDDPHAEAEADPDTSSGDQVPKTATRERSFLPPENPPQVTNFGPLPWI